MTARHCILWTGGKDCFLAALLHCAKAGVEPGDLLFVTLVPQGGCFRCHPLGLIAAHSRYFGAEHRYIVIDGERWYDSYEQAFTYLHDVHGVRAVVTGDAPFDDRFVRTYWFSEFLARRGIDLVLPISPVPLRTQTIDLLDAHEVCAIVSAVKDEYYAESFLGRRLSARLLHETGLCDDPSFDPCGERGEYHTAVTAYRGHRFLGSYAPPLDRKILVDGVWTLDWAPELLAFAEGAEMVELGDPVAPT
jgi:diphthamide synthase (EF-2-diphthine--ammonia ligase)